MSQICNVCDAPVGAPVYQSADNASITTMNKVVPGRTEVFFCEACGHLQTTELPNLDQYYALEYEINLNSEDDDQLYKVIDGRPVYRAEHQANILLKKVNFAAGIRVLDYGCAKAATLRKVLDVRPGVIPYTFDVTEKYVPFWEKFVSDGNWVTGRIRPEWNGTIDVVLSFYALEHVKQLQTFLREVGALLKTDGVFYFIVPNAYANIADFVVADHINHFSEASLRTMLGHAGFEVVEVDGDSHDAAFIVLARKRGAFLEFSPPAHSIDTLRQQVAAMAQFWSNAVRCIREFEAALGDDVRRAIYGAGFYGNFIASALKDLGKIECFVDQNVHLQGQTMLGKKIIPPTALDSGIRAVFVGLNPRVARGIIGEIAPWKAQLRQFLFL